PTKLQYLLFMKAAFPFSPSPFFFFFCPKLCSSQRVHMDMHPLEETCEIKQTTLKREHQSRSLMVFETQLASRKPHSFLAKLPILAVDESYFSLFSFTFSS